MGGILRKLFESVAGGNTERRVQKYAKGCARTMLVSFTAMRHHYKDEAPNYAWLSRKVLDTRPYWNQVGERSFRYEKAPNFDDTSLDPADYSDKPWLTGTIEITDETSLLDVIQDVLRTELYWFFLRDLDILARLELTDIALETAEKYIKGK